MPSATLVGGVLGLGIPLYANALRKMPLWRNPWEHVAWVAAGAAFGSWLVKWERETEKDLMSEPCSGGAGGTAAAAGGQQGTLLIAAAGLADERRCAWELSASGAGSRVCVITRY